MIWLANYNAGPISYTYTSSGQPAPVASAVTIAGQSWYGHSKRCCGLYIFISRWFLQELVLRKQWREPRVLFPAYIWSYQ